MFSWKSWLSEAISGTKKARYSMDEKFSRQADIVPRERILDCKATVIGVGAIGRQVASQLAAIGLPWIQLVDHDVVEESNIASQGYFEDDLKRFKVHATA